VSCFAVEAISGWETLRKSEECDGKKEKKSTRELWYLSFTDTVCAHCCLREKRVRDLFFRQYYFQYVFLFCFSVFFIISASRINHLWREYCSFANSYLLPSGTLSFRVAIVLLRSIHIAITVETRKKKNNNWLSVTDEVLAMIINVCWTAALWARKLVGNEYSNCYYCILPIVIFVKYEYTFF